MAVIDQVVNPERNCCQKKASPERNAPAPLLRVKKQRRDSCRQRDEIELLAQPEPESEQESGREQPPPPRSQQRGKRERRRSSHLPEGAGIEEKRRTAEQQPGQSRLEFPARPIFRQQCEKQRKDRQRSADRQQPESDGAEQPVAGQRQRRKKFRIDRHDPAAMPLKVEIPVRKETPAGIDLRRRICNRRAPVPQQVLEDDEFVSVVGHPDRTGRQQGRLQQKQQPGDCRNRRPGLPMLPHPLRHPGSPFRRLRVFRPPPCN